MPDLLPELPNTGYQPVEEVGRHSCGGEASNAPSDLLRHLSADDHRASVSPRAPALGARPTGL